MKPPFNISSIAQAAAVAALKDRDHIKGSLNTNSSGRAYLEAELHEIGLKTAPTQANFLMICFDYDAKPIYEALLKKGVIIRYLASFGLEKCIRVTIGTESQNRRFVATLKEALLDKDE